MEVRKEDFKIAQAALAAEYRRATALDSHPLPHGDAIFDDSASSTVCPACGCLFSPEQKICPDCGLSFD